MGEKEAKFKRDGVHGVHGIAFQLTDSSKPLASVSRILGNGRRVKFSRGAGGSYIEKTETGVWMPLKEARGAFALEVDWFEPEASQSDAARASGSPRQGN